jgi:hypothetical protein
MMRNTTGRPLHACAILIDLSLSRRLVVRVSSWLLVVLEASRHALGQSSDVQFRYLDGGGQ